MYLDRKTFIKVIAATPFVSIDLIVRNESGEVLLGYRRNRPAQNHWFVPGGRIRKNEKTQDALRRLAVAELNIEPFPGKLIGIFDHFYDDNFYGEPGVSTHYVVCAYEFWIKDDTRFSPDNQHTELKWWPIDALLTSDDVHPNSKLYFQDSLGNGFRCEAVI